MHMVMVVIADRKRFARLIGVDWQIIVGMVVTVLVVRHVVQIIANTYRRHISGVRQEHDGKKENETSSHG